MGTTQGDTRQATRGTAVIAAILAIVGIAVLCLFPPGDGGPYPPCPFHLATGLHCPGCGTLRSLHALLHGRVATAFGQNALSMVVLPIILVTAVQRWRRDGLSNGLASRLFDSTSPRRIRAFAVIVIAFWVLRNVPYSPLTILAPD